MHIGILSFSILGVHALAAGFFTYLQRFKPQRYLQVWTIGWYLLLIHDLTTGAAYWLGASEQGTSGWLIFASKSLVVASGVAFFCAARLYMNSRAWAPGAFLMGSWLGLYVLSLRFEHLWMVQQIGMMGVYLSVAFVFWQ